MILRSWLAFAAMGAGILHLALAPGSPLPLAIVLVPLGAMEFCWGLAVLARGQFVLAGVARAVALAPIIGWAALLLGARMIGAPELAASPTLVPMGVATLFDFVIAISLSVHLRRGRTPSLETPLLETPPLEAPPSEARHSEARRPNAWTQLGGLFLGGLAVSLLMTPALAFTEAGLNNPHATHRPATSVPALEVPDHNGH